MFFEKVAIVGLGLIGGSFALAYKNVYPNSKIIAIGRSTYKLKDSIKLGIVDEIYDTLEAASEADFIMLSTPAYSIVDELEKLSLIVKKGAIITDVGSTKEHIVNEANKIENIRDSFVGSHPMTGSEKSGYKYAIADLFCGKRVVITLERYTNKKYLSIIKKVWDVVGALVITMGAKDHDNEVALSSHLTHLASAGLVDIFKEKNKYGIYGEGFIDTTRIAMGDERVWTDIVKTNKNAIINNIDRYIKEMTKIKQLASSEQYYVLYDYLKKIKEYRNRL